jgi:methionyl-tRNA formyltransferase
LRSVFIGTSGFAAAVLRRLAVSPHRPQLVVTRPDRRRGRGQHLSSPPVAECARELGIAIDQPESVNHDDARGVIAGARPDVVVVCAYGDLIGEALLAAHAMLNVHPSLLPRWRGAAPIERAIMAGDQLTGVSIMRLTAGLDSGPVCTQRQGPILAQDTYGTLSPRLAALGGDLLVATLDCTPPCTEQDDSLATYAQKLTPEDRKLDPARSAVELERSVRALEPHIGAQLELRGGAVLGIREARALSGGGTAPGTLSSDGSFPVLACGEGSLELRVVQPPGRRAMSGADYLRGLRGQAG